MQGNLAVGVVIGIIIFFLGASIFSFLNVVIYRVPKGMNFLTGRSMCTSCGKSLAGYDMIPVFSWMILGGKCRYCKERISIRYPIIEALGGISALVCVWAHGLTIQAVLVFGFLAIALVVAMVDIDTMEIPNGFVMAMAVLAVIATPFFPELTILSRVIGVFAVSLPMLLLCLAIPGAFGGGDIKLMAACGWFLGWQLSLLAFFFAILTGGIYGIYLLVTRKKDGKDHFAFGPYLCFGMVVAWFAGNDLINWYVSLFQY